MCNQWLSRDHVTPSCRRLINLVRQYVDQSIKTRNFKAWSERIETVWNVSPGRNAAERVQWKANGQCWRRESCIFNHGSHFWSTGTIILFCFESGDTDWRKKALCSPCSKKSEFVWIESQKYRVKNPCRSLHRTCNWIIVPSRMTKTSLKSGCKFDDECNFRHKEAGGQISIKAMKSDGKGPVALKKENIQLRCVSQDSSQRKSIVRENGGKLGLNHTQSSSRRPKCVTQKFSKRKGTSQGIVHKCKPQERVPWARQF